MYLHQKIIRIYADIVQNHSLPGVFPNFWKAVYIGLIATIVLVWKRLLNYAYHLTLVFSILFLFYLLQVHLNKLECREKDIFFL